MSDNEILTALEALRGDLARQHGEVIRRLDAILAVLPPPPDRNPLGALRAGHIRTEWQLSELQAALSRGGPAVAPPATVLPMRRSDGDEP